MINLKTLALMVLLFQSVVMNACYSQTKEKAVKIETRHGDIILYLYKATPKHRENFFKLVEDGTLTGTTFHRVIKGFMIQGGDPLSKDTIPSNDGQGGPGYTIPAEIRNDLFHVRGAVAAARLGDQVNPEKQSSGSQFYIVQGTKSDDAQLDNFEQSTNQELISGFIREYANTPEGAFLKTPEFQEMAKTNQDSLNRLYQKLVAMFQASGKAFKFTPEVREKYKTEGGAAFLDGKYTVFGVVLEGMDVVDKIANEQTANDRPLQDVKMKVSTIEINEKDLKEKYKLRVL